MVASVMLCFRAAALTEVKRASHRIFTIWLSVKSIFFIDATRLVDGRWENWKIPGQCCPMLRGNTSSIMKVCAQRFGAAGWPRIIIEGRLCRADAVGAELIPFGIPEICRIKCLRAFFAAYAGRALIRSAE
jgi:hypothetical protein